MIRRPLVVMVACLSVLGFSAASALSPLQSASAHSIREYEPQGQRAAVEAVVKSYQRSLDASDLEGVVRLYTEDAVVMAPNAPDAVGIDAVRATYTGIFQAIALDLTFDVAEVNIVSPDWAFLRSNSTGTLTILANGAHVPSSNHELFVLHKSHGHWKLARYSFSSTLPSA
jgi:uncharacterized protein (TIGR02246 family)